MLISKTDLTKAASRFSRIPSGEQLFNPFEDVKAFDGSIYYPDVIWLMGNCPKLQTNEGLGGYIATKPSAFYIYLLMAECRFAQTPEVFAAFLEAKPDAHILAYFRRDCREFANKPEVIAAIGLPTATAEPEPTPEPEPTTSPATSCLHEGVLLVAALREYRRAYGKDGANCAGVQVAVDIALDRFKAAVSRLQVESRKRVADANFESKPVIDAIEIAQAAIVITHRASNKKAAVAAVDQAVRKLPYLIKLKL
jgi:hypothetical protein